VSQVTNVNAVRRMMEAFNDRDVPTLESIFSEDVTMRLIGGFADLMGTDFRGQDAVLAWMADWVETIGGRAEIETIRNVDDRVLAIATVMTAGALSGTPAALRYGQVYSFRDGRISEFDSCYLVDEALKAVGLAE
jgi:ketosteroid isomerase-like protein